MSEGSRDPAVILALFAEGPARIEAAIADLSEAELDLALEPEEWTIRQYVHHVVDGDDFWKIGVKAALGNSEGLITFQWYWDLSQDTWAERWHYADRALEPSLALFRANRHHTMQLLEQAPDAWDHSIRIRWPNEKEERITIGRIIEIQANHVLLHTDDICAIRQTHNI